MKIWMCSHGCYSDKFPTAFYSNEETAKRMTEACGWDNDPEEFELDPPVPEEARYGLTHFIVQFYFKQLFTGQDGVSVEPCEPKDYHVNGFTKQRHDGGRNFNTYMWARDKDHALKIGADRLAEAQVLEGLVK